MQHQLPNGLYLRPLVAIRRCLFGKVLTLLSYHLPLKWQEPVNHVPINYQARIVFSALCNYQRRTFQVTNAASSPYITSKIETQANRNTPMTDVHVDTNKSRTENSGLGHHLTIATQQMRCHILKTPARIITS